MSKEVSPSELLNEILKTKSFLIVQDLDGVCIPLVKNPLERKIDISYVESAKKLKEEFAVLTNGEHEGYRGVNRVIENAYKMAGLPLKDDIYLPGLAAGGIEYQDRFKQVQYPGVSKKELNFLMKIPELMEEMLYKVLKESIPMCSHQEIVNLSNSAILATRFSPTININRIFNIIPQDIELQREIQLSINVIMENIMEIAKEKGLKDSFYLHIAPNLGKINNKERIKFSTQGDIGTTDIQFMLSGAVKEAGLLVLINKYIQIKFGRAPFGDNFNARIAPNSIKGLITLCQEKITEKEMPLLIGVGDTVTSNKSSDGKEWLRGGSDRGFLTLIQELGKIYNLQNKVVLVDSSSGEVDRPTLSNKDLEGISDLEDPLKFNTFFRKGPESYINWFNKLAEEREVLSSNS